MNEINPDRTCRGWSLRTMVQRRFHPMLALIFFGLVGTSLATGQTSRPNATTDAPGNTGSANPTMLEELDGLLARFPENLRDAKLDAKEVPLLADRILTLAREYVSEYPKAPRAAEIRYQIARFSAMNNQRYVVTRVNELQQGTQQKLSQGQVKAIRDEYILGALSELDKAQALSPDEALQRKIERCRGSLYYFGNYFEAAAEVYQELLTRFPDDPAADETLTSLVGAYEKARNFDAAHNACDQFLAKYMDSDFAPHILNYKGKMLLYLGRLKEAADHFDKYELFMKRAYGGLPAGDSQVVYSPRVRKDFESYIDRLPFQLAFARYAMGDSVVARARLEQSVQTLTAKSTRQALNQVGQVYLDRSRRVLSVLKDLQDDAAPPLRSVDRWLDGSFDLEAEKGNVIALLFFPYENARSEGYLQAVQSFLNERWSEGFRAAWIALPKGKKEFDQQLRRVGENAARLGLTMPAGLATYEEWPPVDYGAYNIAPGTPTVVLVDRSGRVAWYKMDPTFRDFSTSARVVERLLRDK